MVHPECTNPCVLPRPVVRTHGISFHHPPSAALQHCSSPSRLVPHLLAQSLHGGHEELLVLRGQVPEGVDDAAVVHDGGDQGAQQGW